jgi:hypothetical protein
MAKLIFAVIFLSQNACNLRAQTSENMREDDGSNY